MNAKHIFTIVAAGVMLLAACGKKTNTDKDMNTLSFNKEQAAAMTAIACHEARGDQSSLAIAIGEGFDAGLTANQMKEATSPVMLYTGFGAEMLIAFSCCIFIFASMLSSMDCLTVSVVWAWSIPVAINIATNKSRYFIKKLVCYYRFAA